MNYLRWFFFILPVSRKLISVDELFIFFLEAFFVVMVLLIIDILPYVLQL